MDINLQVSRDLSIDQKKVEAAIALLDEGNTVPFIARYRKEVTGGLTDEDLRALEERLTFLRALEDRKKTVYNTLNELGVEDKELMDKIEKALTLAEVEDLYRPYKPKKVTRASKAIKAGLKPLSEYIRRDKTGELLTEALQYVKEEDKDFNTVEKAIQGALDIIAEEISDNANYRKFIKDLAMKKGSLTSEKTKAADSDVYDNYAAYSKRISDLKSYNVLAINRGVAKKCLTKKFVFDDQAIIAHLSLFEIPTKTPYRDLFEKTIQDSYDRLIFPSVSNDIFSGLMDEASEKSIEEFKLSLRATLLYSPLKGKRILGFDPGFSHGCKLAFIDENGKLLDTYVLENAFYTEGGKKRAKDILRKLILKNQTFTIALGNGTASRESQALLFELRKEYEDMKSLEIAIVSESGASIWSATASAQKEFPELEPNLRSAVSIARRLEDPLAELVKIPPESIGVGQYQYDIDQKKLKTALGGVVEDCVNYVGVDVNTASADLLSYIAGITGKIALSIVSYRDKNGAIQSREELKKIPYLGPKSFENCAGFLRIPESKEPLDNTAVHPESYKIAKEVYKMVGTEDDSKRKEILKSYDDVKIKNLAEKLNVGFDTLKDIIHELILPSRDPRKEAKTAKLDESITDIKDLKAGQVLEGTIRNVCAFGFFVDLGVEINGLVHISEISDRRIEDPHTTGKPGDIVKVKVKEVDLQRKRISLTMKGLKQN